MTSYYGDDAYAPQARAGGPGDGYRDSGGGGHNGHAAAAHGTGRSPASRRGSAGDNGFDPFAGEGRAATASARTNGRASVGRSSSGSASTGTASVGSRSAGSAPVGSASAGAASASASAGRAGLGRASVRPGGFDPFSGGQSGSDGGFDPFGDSSPAAGRATIPTAGGRASVGRASVLAPADPDAPDGVGPGGPGGPGGAGAGGGGRPGRKRARRRRLIIACLAALIMLSGIGVITGVYYTSSITLPADVPLQQSTTVYYSDGKTVMARLGDENRVILQDNQIPPIVKQAVTAAEDTSFYSNAGVDFKGIVRAFLNNVKGGDTQGASTITQQYARNIANLTYSQSYTRKLREIVLAMKMTQKMKKDEILDNYLNIVNFGRGAYGIQAAAEAYFNVNASQLKPNQAMVLAGMIKNPNGGVYDPRCGKGGKGPCQTAIDRFNYIKSQMPRVPARGGYLNAGQIAQLTYPTNSIAEANNQARNALSSPQGYIVHHVMDELSHAKKADGTLVFPSTGTNSLKNGGYQIVTTINKYAQGQAVAAASGKSSESPMYKMQKGIGASLVSVQPGTGAVIAYYGGYNGSDIDFGGIYNDPVFGDGHLTNQSVKPGSSFKTVTLATALKQGISVNSYWYGPPTRKFADRPQMVNNAGTGEAQEACPGTTHVCPLWQALQESLNTVFYAVGEDTAHGMSPGKVIDMASDLGVKQLWSDSRCKGARQPLTGSNGTDLWHKCIGGEVSFGGFNVTVQDMANVMATFANNGVRADEHFVKYVKQGFGTDANKVYETATRLTPVPGYTPQMAEDEQWAMQQVYKN